MIHKFRPRFKHELLPVPVTYYKRLFPKLNPAKKYNSVKCLFHNDSSPSLSLNLDTGSYRCFGCDAKGSDILSFHMRRHGLSFKDAMKELNSWK